jgi:hypothetical protein
MVTGRVLLVLLVMASPAYADLRPFHIPAPTGWKEVTSLTPEALAGIPPGIAEKIKTQHYELMAVDLEHASGGFAPNMNVIVGDGGLRVTSSSLRKLGDELMTQMSRNGATAKLVSSRTVRISGVDTARLEVENAFADLQMHQVIYVMPGGDRTAVVTFTASPTQFASYESLFDETAAASRGLKEPSRFDWNEVLVFAAVGGLGAGGLSLLRKRNKSRQAA